ncbi:hypothetical protein PCANB_001529 [Pneumocystis canis]|nr:hypothetical protein PCANB_001529 [Pneumocystis canis]
MTDKNAYIPVISTFKDPKLHIPNLEEKNIPKTLFKSLTSWNINMDLFNVSSIFKNKVKWDSESFKRNNFDWKVDFYSRENKDKKVYKPIQCKIHYLRNINNNFKFKDFLISTNNNMKIKNYIIFFNNTLIRSPPLSQISINHQRLAHYEYLTTFQKNIKLLPSSQEKYEIKSPKSISQKKVFNSSLSPIARNPFPLTIIGKSVISGLSSDITLLRICFRVGEALKIFNLQQNSMILYLIEFFGIIKESIKKEKSFTYIVGDLFHPLKGPYIYATYYGDQTMFTFQNGEIVRILGIFKKKKEIKNELKIIKINSITWEEIQSIKETIK